ncbi:MAG: ComEC family competence protein, partial [Bacteroidales bacterium]|nr:ComEC family competence protein [Bacteroidales bacterium]
MFLWNKYPGLRFLLPFVVGIGIVFYTRIVFPVSILLTIMALALIVLVVLYRFPQYHMGWIGSILVTVFMLSFFVCYTQWFINEGKPPPSLKAGKETVFIASVIENPSIKTNTVSIVVRINHYQYHDTFLSDNSKAVLYVARNEQSEKIAYGDKLSFYSRLTEPPPPTNPKAFNYKRYLSIKNIYLQSYIPANAWQKISEKNGYSILHFSINIRNRFLKIFQEANMDMQEYGIITAMLLGYDDELDPDLEQKYSATGVSHVLCVSGLHVGIIYMILSFFLRFLNGTRWQRITRLFILLTAVWLYACITGLAPSIMRASTMFSFISVGTILNKQAKTYNSLITSMFFLLLFNPLLIFEVGFQLSYLAVFGIVWIQRPLYSLYKARTRVGNYVWEIASVSLAAQLFTAPLAIAYFHQFPNYFLIANIIIIILLPLTLGVGIAVLAFSFWGFAYKCLSLILVCLIKVMNWTVSAVEALPYSLTENIDLSGLQIIFIYLLIVLFFSTFFYRNKLYLFLSFACAIFILGIDIHKQIQVNGQKEITFYSIKSGYAIDCIDGQSSVMICDSNTSIDQSAYSYNIRNNHIYHRIKDTTKITDSHFISFHGKTILIID